MKVRVRRIDKELPLPSYDEADATGKAYPPSFIAGFDLPCREDMTIQPHTIGMMPLNTVIEAPENYFVLLCLRSSTTWKKGLMLANGVAIFDPFFRGDSDEMKAQLFNYTDTPVEVKRGELLVQAVILNREPVEFEEVQTMGAPGHGGYVTNGPE